MEWTDLVIQGVGFIFGGAAMWLSFQFKRNTEEHESLGEALKEHAENEGKTLNEIKESSFRVEASINRFIDKWDDKTQ